MDTFALRCYTPEMKRPIDLLPLVLTMNVTLEIFRRFDDACLLIHQYLLKRHPDQRVTKGCFLSRVRGWGLPRCVRALLLKLRVGWVDSLSCASCETLQHLILAFLVQRTMLLRDYHFTSAAVYVPWSLSVPKWLCLSTGPGSSHPSFSMQKLAWLRIWETLQGMIFF